MTTGRNSQQGARPGTRSGSEAALHQARQADRHAYVSFTALPRMLNEHWFRNLLDARTTIETGGRTTTRRATQLAVRIDTWVFNVPGTDRNW